MGGQSNAKDVVEFLLKNGADGSIKADTFSLEASAPQDIKDVLKKYESLLFILFEVHYSFRFIIIIFFNLIILFNFI